MSPPHYRTSKPRARPPGTALAPKTTDAVQSCLAGVDCVRLRHRCGCLSRAGAPEPDSLAQTQPYRNADSDPRPEPHAQSGPPARRCSVRSDPGTGTGLRLRGRPALRPGRRSRPPVAGVPFTLPARGCRRLRLRPRVVRAVGSGAGPAATGRGLRRASPTRGRRGWHGVVGAHGRGLGGPALGRVRSHDPRDGPLERPRMAAPDRQGHPAGRGS